MKDSVRLLMGGPKLIYPRVVSRVSDQLKRRFNIKPQQAETYQGTVVPVILAGQLCYSTSNTGAQKEFPLIKVTLVDVS